jgi:hypothetical protein
MFSFCVLLSWGNKPRQIKFEKQKLRRRRMNEWMKEENLGMIITLKIW